jgi:hypothetical protein
MIAPDDQQSIDEIVAAVRASLTDELLDAYWRRYRQTARFVSATTGHCFVAAQAVYWLLGGSQAGWVGCVMKIDPTKPRDTHWFVRHRESWLVVDPTADQFPSPPDYALGRGCGFSTRRQGKDAVGPCKRTKVVIERAKQLMAARIPA